MEPQNSKSFTFGPAGRDAGGDQAFDFMFTAGNGEASKEQTESWVRRVYRGLYCDSKGSPKAAFDVDDFASYLEKRSRVEKRQPSEVTRFAEVVNKWVLSLSGTTVHTPQPMQVTLPA